MGYRIDPGRAFDAEVRRIANEQIDAALKGLDAGSPKAAAPDETATPLSSPDPHEGIHEARKKIKNLRGLLRLVRDADPAFYKRENARLRDAARGLSGVRDRAALIEAVDGLSALDAATGKRHALNATRRTLVKRLTDAEARDLTGAVAAANASLQRARRRFEGLTIENGDKPAGGKKARGGKKAKGGGKKRGPDPNAARSVIAAGLGRNHGRAEGAAKAARKNGEATAFHELRKRIKYERMHLKLLTPAWPEAIRPLERAAKGASDALGRDHDFAVLEAELAASPEDFGTPDQVATVRAFLAEQGALLRRRGMDQARALLTEEAEAIGARLARLHGLSGRIAAREPSAGGSREPVDTV